MRTLQVTACLAAGSGGVSVDLGSRSVGAHLSQMGGPSGRTASVCKGVSLFHHNRIDLGNTVRCQVAYVVLVSPCCPLCIEQRIDH